MNQSINPVVILLLVKAFERHGTEIEFCGKCKSWRECVQYWPEYNMFQLWYNTSDNSTHIVQMSYKMIVSDVKVF